MGHSNQGKLGCYFLEAPKMETSKSHIAFDITETTFYFDTSPFSELKTFLRIQVLPGLMFVVVQPLIDFDNPVIVQRRFTTAFVEGATSTAAAFVFLNL
jgi:hypothetical protein